MKVTCVKVLHDRGEDRVADVIQAYLSLLTFNHPVREHCAKSFTKKGEDQFVRMEFLILNNESNVRELLTVGIVSDALEQSILTALVVRELRTGVCV